MRGLSMALFAFEFPGHDGNRAGRGAVFLLSTKTMAKTTTTKTV